MLTKNVLVLKAWHPVSKYLGACFRIENLMCFLKFAEPIERPGFSAAQNARLEMPIPKDEALHNKSEPDDLELVARFQGCRRDLVGALLASSAASSPRSENRARRGAYSILTIVLYSLLYSPNPGIRCPCVIWKKTFLVTLIH
jgi:hypothetical protein